MSSRFYTHQEIVASEEGDGYLIFSLDRKRGEQWPQEPVLLGELGDLEDLEKEIAEVLRPTPRQLYEATLHGFDETSGDVEAPTGWFAWINWPNGKTYLITHDEHDNTYLKGEALRTDEDAMAQLHAEYQVLVNAYDAWTDIEEQEM